jgi:hypothetical protein
MAPAPGRRLENHQDVGEESGNDKFEKKSYWQHTKDNFH